MSPGFVQVNILYSSVREVEKCGVKEAEIWGDKKVFVAKTVQWCSMNCVLSVLSCGVSTRGTQVTVPMWLLGLCVVAGLRTCIHL